MCSFPGGQAPQPGSCTGVCFKLHLTSLLSVLTKQEFILFSFLIHASFYVYYYTVKTNRYKIDAGSGPQNLTVRLFVEI